MKIHEITTPKETVQFILGCLNDFENGISTKEETTELLSDLIIHIAVRASDATAELYKKTTTE